MIQSLFDVVVPVFLVIGAGYVATRANFFTSYHVDGLMKFTQNFAIPCLLFYAIATIDLKQSFEPGLLVSFYGAAGLCFAAGMAGARLLFKRDWEDCVVIGFACLFSNSLLLGLPITERAFGQQALVGNYAIIAFHSPFCYGLGLTVMEFFRARGKTGLGFVRSVLSAMFNNTLIMGIALGFLFNISGLAIPGVVDDALQLIIRAALPCALFALGGVLVQYRPEGDLRAITFVCAISLLLHPTLVWLFGTALAVPQDLFRSAIMNSAMPPGFNAYIFANLYGRAKRVAASSVLTATGASVLTVWLWLIALGHN
ncbi:AEC family transporter [Pseudooceanicola sp.]|uniref:AEC family transporter n=1 Tax=Pseudooceanicola sp. TaxID=1914328 RepID=UPI003518825D